MMGKELGVCSGLGGSQHICSRNFFSNGIQGSYMPIVVGMALGEKMKKSGAVVTAFIGDGTLGQGVVYEAFNLASLYQVPLLTVIENNQIAQTTPIYSNLAGSVSARPRAFGIPTTEMDTADVDEIHECAGKLISQMRKDSKPHVLILNTQRLGPHSKGDDSRSVEHIAKLREFDPIPMLEKKIGQQIYQELCLQAQEIIFLAESKSLDSKTRILEFPR
jgi:TPP-dependent pyruvate/acetoin dehydrogenase alpha subunit